MTSPFEKAKLAGYTVAHENGEYWRADNPAGDIVAPPGADFWPSERAAWEACDNHRMFGHVLGARGELIAAGYDVWAPRPDMPWLAKLNGAVIGEGMESEPAAWEACERHRVFGDARTPAPVLKAVVIALDHLSLATVERLKGPHEHWPICGGRFGGDRFMVHATPDDDGEIPRDLFAVTSWAAAQGFDRIEFDPEAALNPALKVYDHDPRPPVDALEAFAKVRALFATWEGWSTHADGYDPADLLEKIAEAVGAELNGKPAAPVAESAADRVRRYDDQLNEWELSPNGDDYNAIYSMSQGGFYSAPHREGR